MKNIIFLSLFFIVTGCSKIKPKPDNDFYLPISKVNFIKGEKSKIDTIFVTHFTQALKKLGEQNISNLNDGDDEIYRLTVTSSIFYPKIYRLFNLHNSYVFVSKSDDKSFQNDSIVIPSNKVSDFKREISVVDFNKMNKVGEVNCHDGDTLILEVYKDGEYHFIIRNCPENNPDYIVINALESLKDLAYK